MKKNKTVYVGMSGGVDSSVTALLLKEQGYDVVGVYMKCWDGLPTPDGVKFKDTCSWRDEKRDAMMVAAKLNIPFKMYDFTKEYREKVIDYFFQEYEAGRTPNPDIACNSEIKFKLFLKLALSEGADYIATGHYVQRRTTKNGEELRVAKDKSKDQSYFLWTLTQEQIKKSLFPVGGYLKSEVRILAQKAGLKTAEKKDSQGICFVGKVSVEDFLRARIPEKIGKVVTTDGKEVGEHRGTAFYTIGQRHGLKLSASLPYYVVGKDIKKNIVYVGEGNSDAKLYSTALKCFEASWINEPPKVGKNYLARIRYRQPLQEVKIVAQNNGAWSFEFKQVQRAVTSGQSLVLYEKERMLGGGIIV